MVGASLRQTDRLGSRSVQTRNERRESLYESLSIQIDAVATLRQGLEGIKGENLDDTLARLEKCKKRCNEVLEGLSPHQKSALQIVYANCFTRLIQKAYAVDVILQSPTVDSDVAKKWKISVDDVVSVERGVCSVHTIADPMAEAFLKSSRTRGKHMTEDVHNLIKQTDDAKQMQMTRDHEDIHNVWECMFPGDSRNFIEKAAHVSTLPQNAQRHFLLDTLHEEFVAQLDARIQGDFNIPTNLREIASTLSSAGNNFATYISTLNSLGDEEREVATRLMRDFKMMGDSLVQAYELSSGEEGKQFFWAACAVLKPSQYAKHLIPLVLRHFAPSHHVLTDDLNLF